jgi:hypothetical protein
MKISHKAREGYKDLQECLLTNIIWHPPPELITQHS